MIFYKQNLVICERIMHIARNITVALSAHLKTYDSYTPVTLKLPHAYAQPAFAYPPDRR